MKVCRICHKPFDELHEFKTCNACRERHRKYCMKYCEANREKERKRHQIRRAENPEREKELKDTLRARREAEYGNICSRCFKPLESTQYRMCESCRKKARAYRKANPEKSRAAERKWHRKNPDYSKEYKRGWNARHPQYQCPSRTRRKTDEFCSCCGTLWESELFKTCDRCRETDRKWRFEHPVRNRTWEKNHPEYNREYKKKHRKRYTVNENNRRARIKGNGGELPPNAWAMLFDLQGGICYLCSKPLYKSLNDPPQIEHKIPVSRGGKNILANVGLAHTSCNARKHMKTPDEFLEHLARKNGN
jgi:hypothetical protein